MVTTTTSAATGPSEVAFGWASVTKLVAALAVLVAVEDGTVGLDDPAGPPGSSLRHLLAHASGLALDNDLVLAAPGTRRIYSNRGIEVALEVVAQAAAISWEVYVEEAVLGPLGLTNTTIEGTPASGAVGPLRDLLLVGEELWHPTLVAPSTLALALTPAWPELAGVLPGFGLQTTNSWGLGIEIRGNKSPHWTGRSNSESTYGHFGRSGAFLWIDPVAEVLCAGLSDQPFGPWATVAWPALADAVIAEVGSAQTLLR